MEHFNGPQTKFIGDSLYKHPVIEKNYKKLGDSGGPLWVEENGKGMIWYYICYLSEYEVSLFEVK